MMYIALMNSPDKKIKVSQIANTNTMGHNSNAAHVVRVKQ